MKVKDKSYAISYKFRWTYGDGFGFYVRDRERVEFEKITILGKETSLPTKNKNQNKMVIL